MKKLLSVITFILFAIKVFGQCPTFSINAPSGTTITCSKPSISLNAIDNSGLSNITYTWVSLSTGSLTGASIVASAPLGTNVYTVISSVPTNTCTYTRTISISTNTVTPGCTVTPVTRTMSCGTSCASFTATSSSTANISGVWLASNNAIQSGPSNSPVILCGASPEIFRAVFTNTINGCTSSQTVAVTASATVPTMSVISNESTFTMTCNTPSITMAIITSSTLTPKTFTWTNIATNISMSTANGGYTVTTPGYYRACLKAASCVVCQTVTIFQDTIRPIVSAVTNLPGNTFTLTCAYPVLTSSAVTSPTLPITSYSWTAPPNTTISQPTINVNLSNITSSTTPTSYTVLAKGSNGCIGRKKVDFYKDTYVPPYIPVFTPTAITCASSCIAMSTGASTSTVPITFTFTSPAPTQTANTNGYLFCTPGTYTMTYMSVLNGCTATSTTLVPLNVTPPSTVSVAPAILCSTVNINAGVSSTLAAYSYTWTGPPGALMSSPNTYTTDVNAVGVYTVLIKSNINGCITYNYVSVTGCTGLSELSIKEQIKLRPNPSNGVFEIVIPNDLIGAEIEVFNLLGQKATVIKLNQVINEINLSHLAKGVYNLIVKQKEIKIKNEKIIIE